MGVIDAHVHVWDTERFDYPWLAGLPALDAPMLPGDVDRAGGRVSGMVFVQADCAAESSLDEARWVSGAEWPELAGIVAAANLHDEAALPRHLDALAEIPGVVGIRHLLQGEPDSAFESAAVRSGLGMLAERGLSFDACVRHDQLPRLVTLLRGLPTLKVVLDHLGKPPIDEGIDSHAGRAWATAIGQLAALDSVTVKISGLTAETQDAAALDRNAGAFIRHTVESFGADRAMIGSDWPVSAMLGTGGTLEAWIARVQEATGASAAERSAIEGGSAQSFYGLPDAAD